MDKIICENPDRGKSPTKIDAWKYQLVSKAIRKALPSKGDGLPFKDLPGKVTAMLTAEQVRKIGSITWYTTTVKLDMEAKGLIERVPKVKPQRLRRR